MQKGMEPPWSESDWAGTVKAPLIGRYPFMAVANQYLRVMDGVLADSTHKELTRRLKRMNKDLICLKDEGKIKSCNPYILTDQDVLAYISLLRSRGMHDGGIDHNIDGLAGLLKYIGNGAVDKAKRRYKQHFPHGPRQCLDPLRDRDRKKIIETAQRIPTEEWRRMLAYGISVVGICSGFRPKELRFCNINDMDLDQGEIHAESVKGLGRYGKPRNAAIHPDGIPFLRRYLEARSMALEKRYLVSDCLFPAIGDLQRGGDGVYSISGTAQLRYLVKKETGISFDFRACRRTYGQVGIDQGVPLDAISRMLGHSNTKTTETYYARKKNETAIDEAKRVWSKNETNQRAVNLEFGQSGKNPAIVNPPEIKEIWRMTGYG